MISIKVDAGDVFSRQLSDLERKQLPFATVQAINATAFATRERWKEIAAQVFDRPTALTLNAVLYLKATLAKPVATIFIRDEATKGTAPAKYLQSEVMGGQRQHKGIERDLQRRGILSAMGYVVPGKGAQLDAFGNIPRSQINAIKSQLGAFGEQGYTANQSDVSNGRRRQQRQLARRAWHRAGPRAAGAGGRWHHRLRHGPQARPRRRGRVMRATRFETFQDKQCQWRWRLLSPNNRVIAIGEAYTRRSSALRSARLIKAQAKRAEVIA